MPKISVIIPCYNAEKYLDLCIQSVLNQTLQDIEILCVDDGSQDRTVEMLQGYAARDSRLKVLCQKNLFAGVARNTGMDAATGEYFAFLDSDDTYERDGLEKAWAIAKEQDLDMLKLSSYLLDDATGEVTANDHYSHTRFPQKNQVLSFRDAPKNFLNCADVAWNGLYKAEFIRSNGIRFNNFRCVNDRSFYISCLTRAKRILVADEYLTCYRRNIAGSLVSIRHRFFQCQTGSYCLIRDILRENEVSPSDRRMAMQLELHQIFLWYQKFLDGGVNTFQVEQVIREFMKTFDENDVGRDFLDRFPFRNHLSRFRDSLSLQWQTEVLPGEPAVSVIVPVHNSVRFLTECLESILLQSFRDFELICVNDGSTDASAEILECFAQADCRVRILTQPQSGAGAARNNAIQVARGKYLVFVDSDDKIDQNFLKLLHTTAEANKADVVVTPWYNWSGVGDGVPMRNWFADKYLPKGQAFSWADAPDYILTFTSGGPGGKLFRREFILEKQVKFLQIRRSEDFNFIFCAIASAQRVVNLTDSGYYYRNNPTSLENTKDQSPLLFWEATETFGENLKQLPYFDQLKRGYLNNAINRMALNLKAMNSYEGFREVYAKFREVAHDKLELDQHEEEYFFDTTSYNFLMPLMAYDRAEDFLYARYKQSLLPNNQLALLQSHFERSASYRIGRFITFIPRKCRGLLDCIRDHGLRYTVKYGLQKVLSKLR